MTKTPATADEAAAILADCARGGQRVVIRGGATKADWGARAPAPDVVLSTLSLNHLIAHRHGDLTATVEAGARLEDVNRELARHGQWIPLDPPWSDRATIGGIVATNDAGPRRHRYGTPRDLIIGVEIARADGVRAKAGGIVVKNVAGYDLARLMTGSFGSLALITSATFKLYPLPQASRTVVIGLHSHAATAALVDSINASQLTPTAVEIQMPPRRMLVCFESTEASVEAQATSVTRMAASFGVSAAVLSGDDERELWCAHVARPWAGDGCVIKVTLLPNDLGDVVSAIDDTATGATVDIIGRAGVGVLFVRIDADVETQSRTIDRLRARVPLDRGRAVLLHGSEQLKAAVNPWGPLGDAARVMASVKRAFDPNGMLAAAF